MFQGLKYGTFKIKGFIFFGLSGSNTDLAPGNCKFNVLLSCLVLRGATCFILIHISPAI